MCTRARTHTHTHSLTHAQCLTGPAYLTERAEPHLCPQPPKAPPSHPPVSPLSLFLGTVPSPSPPPWPRVTVSFPVPNSALSPLRSGPRTLTQRCPRATLLPPMSARRQRARQPRLICLHPRLHESSVPTSCSPTSLKVARGH